MLSKTLLHNNCFQRANRSRSRVPIPAPPVRLNTGLRTHYNAVVIHSPQVCYCQASIESFNQAELKEAFVNGQINEFPTQSGVYAVYDKEDTLRYVGISRNMSMTIGNHAKALGEVVHAVKLAVIANATKDDLTGAWKDWLQEAVNETGRIPAGNAEEKEKWQPRRAPAAKPEVKLTAGKGADDLTCDIKELIQMLVENERIVAFIKGTRTQPQCGFSYQLLTTLNSLKAQFEVVNVLDEVYNPGLREAIKEFSAWPTIPQLYVSGEFVGGSDIVQEMAGNGELSKLLNASS